MPGFQRNQGTNLKLKTSGRLDNERSEILNSGSTQHLKKLFNESFSLVASKRCYTAFFASFLRELGNKLKTEKRTPF